MYRAREGGNSSFSFLEVWKKLVPAEHRQDQERALELEQLFKFHSTFMNFETAGVLEIGNEKRWTSMSEEQHGTRHYTNVVNYRNRFKI